MSLKIKPHKALVINLFGAPGAGKSTGAAYIFSRLKMVGLNAELVTEFAKDKVWEGATAPFENQLYILGKQSYRFSRCAEKVEVIITDSPILNSIYYNHDPVLGKAYNELVKNVADSYESINYFVNRIKKYNPAGRFQTENESDKCAIEIKQMLNEYNVDYCEIDGKTEDYDKVIDYILLYLQPV